MRISSEEPFELAKNIWFNFHIAMLCEKISDVDALNLFSKFSKCNDYHTKAKEIFGVNMVDMVVILSYYEDNEEGFVKEMCNLRKELSLLS